MSVRWWNLRARDQGDIAMTTVTLSQGLALIHAFSVDGFSVSQMHRTDHGRQLDRFAGGNGNREPAYGGFLCIE
jgi:hypothetical protein